MRRRHVAALVSFSLLYLAFLVRPAVAQAPPSDSEAVGELLGGDGAGVIVTHEKFQPASPGSGAGAGPDEWTCIRKGGTSGNSALADFSSEKVESDYQEALLVGQTTIQVELICTNNITGQTVPTSYTYPPQNGAAVDPQVLAQIAKDRLHYPPPSGNTTPPADPGPVAQLPTYFYIDNFQPVTASATAGPVTATVTATPVSQTWTIEDSLRGDVTFSCEGPGVAYDPTSGGVPPAGACVWRPPHSSAGQEARHEESGKPCFPTTVTITWSVSWTASGAPGGGDLGTGTSSSSTCIVVEEIQAVVTDAP